MTSLVDPRTARLGRATSLLLVLLVFASVHATAIVDGIVLGPQYLGRAVARVELGLLLASLAASLPPATALLTVWLVAGLLREERRAFALTCVLAVTLAGTALVPLSGVAAPLSHFPGAKPAFVGAFVALLTLCVRGMRRGRTPAASGSLRPLFALLAWCLTWLVVGGVRESIPTAPSAALVPGFRKGPGTPLAVPAPTPPEHPWLSAGAGSNLHHDGDMSDAYFDRALLDVEAAREVSYFAGGVCASVTFDKQGRLRAVCVSATRVQAYALDPNTLRPLATLELARRPLRSDFATHFGAGGYVALDREERLIVPLPSGRIARFSLVTRDGKLAFEAASSFDVADTLRAGESITSALPDASGSLWYVGGLGTVGLLDVQSGRARALHFAHSDIENSFALGQRGGAYVVTSRELLALEASPDGAPRVRFRAPYDRGTRQKPGQTSRASGTTPTVFAGGRLVAITDNADPRMHVVVYDASDAPEGPRELCRVPVFAAGKSATDNSLSAVGTSLFVENNYGYGLFATRMGHTTEPGFARIDVTASSRRCTLAWSNDELSVPSVVSKGVAQSGLVLSYAKPHNPFGIDAWYLTGLDMRTGKVAFERLMGTGIMHNNHYAAAYVGPDGSVYVGVVGGIVGLVR